MWHSFHFLRPWFLLLLIPILASCWLKAWRSHQSSGWQMVIDPHLLRHLLANQEEVRHNFPRLLMLPLFLSLLCLSLAGPSWQKIAQPSELSKKPLIILFDLSAPMLSTDISPTRLKRAIFKLKDLLALEQGREVALIAFAGDAHVVVPLTSDHQTILHLAESLSPSIMPVAGARLLSALEIAHSMAERSHSAHIIAMTASNIDDSPSALNQWLKQQKLRITAWTFATEAGAPLLNSEGSFDRDQGAVHLSVLKTNWLGPNIDWQPMSADDHDVKAVSKQLAHSYQQVSSANTVYDSWHDMGPYMLILVGIVFLLASFCYGSQWWMLSLFLLIGAVPKAEAFEWSSLWQRSDQKDYAKLSQGAQQYRSKQYDQAAQSLSEVISSDGFYNLGNSLAHLGKIKEAIAAYEQALKFDANNVDARFNKELLEKQQQKQNQEHNQEQKPEQQQPKEPSKPEGKPEETQKPLDNQARYYFEQLEQNNNFYLKRKFLDESRKKTGAKP